LDIVAEIKVSAHHMQVVILRHPQSQTDLVESSTSDSDHCPNPRQSATKRCVPRHVGQR
jgi:hypothetical protein